MAKKSAPIVESNSSEIRLDNYDLKILRLLQANSRTTVKEIAQQISLSTTPVHERIKRLELSGVIKQYTAIVNPASVRRGLTVICYISLKEHSKTAGLKFVNAILNMPEVLECYSISGEFDFMLKVLEENMQTYYDFHVNKLSQIENIGNIQSVFVMGVIKQTHSIV